MRAPSCEKGWHASVDDWPIPLDEARKDAVAIPDYAFDCHTAIGRKRGRTRTDFCITEHDALTPRSAGLFDADLELLRKGKRS